MDERVFATLHDWLQRGSVVLASVIESSGATPRQRGSRMLISDAGCAFSIGGGRAEARVVEAAHRLLATEVSRDVVEIDLAGGAGSAGICGGRMLVALRRWSGDVDRQRARAIQAMLSSGSAVDLQPDDLGLPQASQTAIPNPRLLIIGAGHCGRALHDMAGDLDFDIWVNDARQTCFDNDWFAHAKVLCGDAESLMPALDTSRGVYAVLLNRDFHADIAALDVLCRRPPAFIGMMGSRRRIGTVISALPQHRDILKPLLVAPVGLDIEAETPHEIAVSILAQLIRQRRRRE